MEHCQDDEAPVSPLSQVPSSLSAAVETASAAPLSAYGRLRDGQHHSRQQVHFSQAGGQQQATPWWGRVERSERQGGGGGGGRDDEEDMNSHVTPWVRSLAR